jgi:hypothetical protein
MFPPRAEDRARLNTSAQIGRRGLLQGLVAIPAAAAMPVTTVPPASAAPAPAVPDPIFPAIEAHHRAYAALKAAPASLDDDEVAEYAQLEIDAADVLQETAPTTLEGLFALLTYLPVAIEQQNGDTFHGLGLLFGDSADIFIVLAEAVILLRGQVEGGRHA